MNLRNLAGKEQHLCVCQGLGIPARAFCCPLRLQLLPCGAALLASKALLIFYFLGRCKVMRRHGQLTLLYFPLWTEGLQAVL